MRCSICTAENRNPETALVRSNIRRFRHREFNVWRCQHCRSIHCEKIADLADYYEDYALRQQTRGYFMDAGLAIILRRLRALGLKKSHRILDYGCGHGVLLSYLRDQGYKLAFGYDPYTSGYSDPKILNGRFDFVLCLDVIEHDPNFRSLIKTLSSILNPAGTLIFTSPNADFINLQDPEKTIHFLHMPCHVQIFSPNTLKMVIETETNLRQLALYNNWFMNAVWPGTSTKFFMYHMSLNGNDLESAFDRPRFIVILFHPLLIYYLFFGWFHSFRNKDHFFLAFRALECGR